MNHNDIEGLRPGQEERISHLFRRGHSLDLVSELGLLYGWTRNDAKAVLAEHGWALDWSGRLQSQYMRGDMPVWPSVAMADPERLLNAGIDHEDADIRKVAIAAEKVLEKLRAALLMQEQRDAETAADKAVSEALSAVFGGIPRPRGRVDGTRAS